MRYARYLLIAILLAFAGTAQAQLLVPHMVNNSGIFVGSQQYNDGEGLLVTERRGKRFIFLYTYESNQGCWLNNFPNAGNVTPGTCHEPTFYIAFDDIGPAGAGSGLLFKTLGIDAPFGIPMPANPFGSLVGEAHVVGFYIIVPCGNGYRMRVTRFGNILKANDSLYDRTMDFDHRLFYPE